MNNDSCVNNSASTSPPASAGLSPAGERCMQDAYQKLEASLQSSLDYLELKRQTQDYVGDRTEVNMSLERCLARTEAMLDEASAALRQPSRLPSQLVKPVEKSEDQSRASVTASQATGEGAFRPDNQMYAEVMDMLTHREVKSTHIPSSSLRKTKHGPSKYLPRTPDQRSKRQDAKKPAASNDTAVDTTETSDSVWADIDDGANCWRNVASLDLGINWKCVMQ